jgi:hypothetical protein
MLLLSKFLSIVTISDYGGISDGAWFAYTYENITL